MTADPIRAALDTVGRQLCCFEGHCHHAAGSPWPCNAPRRRAEAARAIVAFFDALPPHLTWVSLPELAEAVEREAR